MSSSNSTLAQCRKKYLSSSCLLISGWGHNQKNHSLHSQFTPEATLILRILVTPLVGAQSVSLRLSPNRYAIVRQLGLLSVPNPIKVMRLLCGEHSRVCLVSGKLCCLCRCTLRVVTTVIVGRRCSGERAGGVLRAGRTFRPRHCPTCSAVLGVAGADGGGGRPHSPAPASSAVGVAPFRVQARCTHVCWLPVDPLRVDSTGVAGDWLPEPVAAPLLVSGVRGFAKKKDVPTVGRLPCVNVGLLPSGGGRAAREPSGSPPSERGPGRVTPACDSYLVDPASSHMLVSKTKPCMSKYKCFYTVKLRMAH